MSMPCWSWLPADAFCEHHRSWQSSHNRVCGGCVDKRVCKQYNVLRCDYEFTDMEWKKAAWPASSQGRCRDSMRKYKKHTWHCAGCNETKLAPQSFSEWLEGRLCQSKKPSARCNYCASIEKDQREVQQNKSVSMVVKSSDPTSAALAATATDVQNWCEHCMSAKFVDISCFWRQMVNTDFLLYAACPERP